MASTAHKRRPLSEAMLERSGGWCEEHPPLGGEADGRADRRRDYERWLAQATERADPFLALLGIGFALIVAFELADPGLSPEWNRGLKVAGWALWGVFVVDFAARLISAPSIGGFLRRHWLALVMLLVPTLRVLRLAALLRLGRALPAARVVSSSYRASNATRKVFSSRAGYLGGVAGLATLAAAELVWLAERGERTFATFGDALLWAGAAVVGMQAEPVPETAAGRLVMIGAFAVGLVLIASLAASVGAYLLEGRDEERRTSV